MVVMNGYEDSEQLALEIGKGLAWR
jgi:hypothetical protein